MDFSQTYEMSANPIAPISWRDYCTSATQRYKTLLDQSSDESDLQKFFERNPCFVPGAHGIFSSSGHPAMHRCLFTQPRLPGLATKVPDFMWIAKNSDYILPVLIEIESPRKMYFNKDNSLTADFNQAKTQILDWKAWFEDPVNVQSFQRDYKIDTDLRFNMRKVKPLFLLIYGRSNETEKSQERANRKAQSSHENIMVMSFDRLAASHDQTTYLCGRVRSGGFEVTEFPEYLMLSPGLAQAMHRFHGQTEAVERNQDIQPDRKAFLLERLEYWNRWVQGGARGIQSLGDME